MLKSVAKWWSRGLALVLMAAGLVTACTAPLSVTPVPTPRPTATGTIPDGPVIVWWRMGGIAGFCDGVALYGDGRVMVGSCEDPDGSGDVVGTLSDVQLGQVQAWIRGFTAFEVENADPAVADAMTVALSFAGIGPDPASDVDRQTIESFAAEVYAQHSRSSVEVTPTPEVFLPVLEEARAVDAARAALVESSDVDPAAFDLVDVAVREWPDACLGLPDEGEMCAAVITPGYRVALSSAGETYVVRTNKDATMVRIEEGASSSAVACITAFEARELREPYRRVDGEARFVLSGEELGAYLSAMGIASACIPQELGAPFVNADWHEGSPPGTTGWMLSIGFEDLYAGSGWGDGYLIYATYDFATGSEYDTFARPEDWEAAQGSSDLDSDVIEVDGVRGLVRFQRGLCYGACSVFRTIIFPFEQSYVAVVQRVGEIDGETDWDALAEELAAGASVEGWAQPLRGLEQLARSLRFEPRPSVVDWDEAVAMILDGQVTQVLQAHSLRVTLSLDDGSTVTTTEPAIDDIFDVISRCGEICSDIVLATE